MHFGRWIIVAGLVALAAAMPQRSVRADAAVVSGCLLAELSLAEAATGSVVAAA